MIPNGIAPSQRHAAGHLDSLTVDPTILIREEPGDHRSDIVRHARPAKRGHLGNALVNLRIVTDHAAAEIRLDGAWSDDICGDAPRSEFFGQVTRQDLHCAFCRPISRAPRY